MIVRVERVERVAGDQLVSFGFHVPSCLGVVEKLTQPGEPGEHPALDGAQRLAEPLCQLGLGVAAVVRELDRLPLRVGQETKGGLHAVTLEAQPCRLLGAAGDRRAFAIRVLERLGAAALLASHEIDGAAMHESQDPGARLCPVGRVGRGCAPEREEALLHGVFRQPVVAQDAVREAVRDAAYTVVELGQRRLVATRDERDERLIREVSLVLTHRPRNGFDRRYHGACGHKHCSVIRSMFTFGFVPLVA